MYGLIQVAYDEENQEKFKELYQSADSEDQMLLRSALAHTLKDRVDIIPSHGVDWFLCTLAQYSRESEDVIRVLQSIINNLRKFHFGILDENIEFKPVEEIADTCIVGVGFFREKMERLHDRHGAPSVDYYSQAGALAFVKTGYERIGNDFRGWTEFIEKELTL